MDSCEKEHFDEEPEKITPASNEIEFHLMWTEKLKRCEICVNTYVLTVMLIRICRLI